MLRFHLSCALLLVLAGAPAVRAEDTEDSAPMTFDVERFYRDVRTLAARHYPDATAHRLENKIHFEHDTRIFLVHVPLMTGEWQDPREERGPRRGGVYCDIWYRPGPYQGQAMAPQTSNRHYFIMQLLAPYSEQLDAHLHVHLKLPGNAKPPEDFVSQFTALINGFEAYARTD